MLDKIYSSSEYGNGKPERNKSMEQGNLKFPVSRKLSIFSIIIYETRVSSFPLFISRVSKASHITNILYYNHQRLVELS